MTVIDYRRESNPIRRQMPASNMKEVTKGNYWVVGSFKVLPNNVFLEVRLNLSLHYLPLEFNREKFRSALMTAKNEWRASVWKDIHKQLNEEHPDMEERERWRRKGISWNQYKNEHFSRYWPSLVPSLEDQNQ